MKRPSDIVKRIVREIILSSVAIVIGIAIALFAFEVFDSCYETAAGGREMLDWLMKCMAGF